MKTQFFREKHARPGALFADQIKSIKSNIYFFYKFTLVLLILHYINSAY